MIRNSFFDIRKIGPFRQGGLAMILVTIVTLFCFFFKIKTMQSWNMIFSPIFLYCCYNPILGAFREKWLPYIAYSILVFLVLAMYIYVSGNFVSDFSYRHSDELHRMTVLAVIFYFLLNLLCLMFRGVLYLLETMDD
jgi:hypothetical protein